MAGAKSRPSGNDVCDLGPEQHVGRGLDHAEMQSIDGSAFRFDRATTTDSELSSLAVVVESTGNAEARFRRSVIVDLPSISNGF